MVGAPGRLAFRELRLRQFRNFSELEQAFPPAGVAIIGENGAGKTNLLEAIYYLEIFRSFRGAPDEQLVRFGAEAFHIRGRFAGGGSNETSEVTAAFELRGRRKKATRNGVEPDRIGDALGQVGAVIFSPADVAIVQGSPAERRRFLDIVLSLNRAGYLSALQRYRQVLRQRNAVLRAARAVGSLHAWDDALIETGSTVMAARAEWIAANATSYAQRYRAISGGADAVLRYVCSVEPRTTEIEPVVERLAVSFRAELSRLAGRERERRITLCGPHRDDVAFLLRRSEVEIDLREFGSGGQVRTAAIALRMVEADSRRAARQHDPLILLDDVFAELDRARSLRILELLESEQPGQVVLTAPKESDLELRRGQLEHWSMADGRIRR